MSAASEKPAVVKASPPITPYLVSTPPHLKAKDSITSIMKLVALALLPAYLWAGYIFGWYALLLTAICVLSCVVTEVICQRLRHKPVTISDWSAVVTGLLLAGVIPPNVSWWVPVVGGVFAIGVAKHCFGGLGHNIWNPALLSRAFLQNALPDQITSGQWASLSPERGLLENLGTSICGSFKALADSGPDIITGATTLATIQVPKVAEAGRGIATDWSLVQNSLIGLEGGTIAEVSVAALLLGGLFLLLKKVITWEIPVLYIGTVALLSWILPAPVRVGAAETAAWTPWCSGPWALHLVGGGLFIGAFFMATDYVTSPMSRLGRIVFGLGCGFMTVVIRLYAGYPEGVCYAILIMNTCVPLIDSWTRPVKFGAKKG